MPSFEPPGWRELRPWALAALALHILPFAVRPALIGGDEPHYALAAHSLAVGHGADLSPEYAAVEGGSSAAGSKRAGQALDRHLREVNGRPVFSHPLGLPLIAAPLVALQQAVAPGSAPDIPLGVLGLAMTFAGLLAGWRLLASWLGDARRAALVAAGLYFSTPLWYYSRTFFTEPYTWAFAVLAVACLEARRHGLAAVFLGLTLAMKETALLLVVPILLATLAVRGARCAAALASGPVVVALGWIAKNELLLGEAFVPFQPFRVGSPLAGVAGLLLDPARGMLWFAPLAVVATAGWWVAGRCGPADRAARLAAAAIALAYFALSACWVDWRGGTGYGPRLLVPVLPAFAVPLAAWLDSGRSSRAVRGLLAAAFLAGFTLQWCAALSPVHAFWDLAAGDLLRESWLATLAGAGVGATLLWLVAQRFPAGRAAPG